MIKNKIAKFVEKINIYNLKSYVRNKLYSYLNRYDLKKKIINHEEIQGIIKNRDISGDIEILFKENYKIICPKKNIDVIIETCVNEDYSKKGYVIKENDLIIDVGANLGGFSIYAAKKGAKVLAFEPDPYNLKYLMRNIEINNLKDSVSVYNKAVSDRVGKIRFSLNVNHACNSIIDNNDKKCIEVETTTINQIINDLNLQNIKLLKIDVEGAEYLILPNILPENYMEIERIVGEYHLFRSQPDFNYKKIKKILSPFYSKIKHRIPYYFIATK